MNILMNSYIRVKVKEHQAMSRLLNHNSYLCDFVLNEKTPPAGGV
jgi:hypothetical protein